MILGRGIASSDEAILAEFEVYLATESGIVTERVRERVAGGAGTLYRRIGGPISSWTEEQVASAWSGRCKASVYGYCVFLAFLLFRGYFRVHEVGFFAALPVSLLRLFRPALEPIRRKLEATHLALDYTPNGAYRAVGPVLSLLIYLLAFAGKPLEQLKRADFDTFHAAYDTWYRTQKRRADGGHDARLFRLERFLVHWGVLPPRRPVFKHEEHFARLRHEAIREAIVVYMRWAQVKYRPSTIHSCRAGILGFFLWLQEAHPGLGRLDAVTRSIALEYAAYLKDKVEAGTYSCQYRGDLYRRIRLFMEFAIVERLASSPNRNPFARGDTPIRRDPVPRYLNDHEIQVVLRYCASEASLVERVVFTTLLHTGVRAGELAALKTTDLVEIQGHWKLHIHEGKGLKDRLIPLTETCLAVLRAWQAQGWERATDFLFTRHGRPWSGLKVGTIVRETGRKLGLEGLTPHRFRHSFAVALLNHGLRESALQKLLGHKTLEMTLQYGRILDKTVEASFGEAVGRMQHNGRSWVPSFFARVDYQVLSEGDSLNWIRLPVGYCRRNPRLNCEGDVKCLLCECLVLTPEDVPRLRQMQARFEKLGLEIKAGVVAAQLRRIEASGTVSGDGASSSELPMGVPVAWETFST